MKRTVVEVMPFFLREDQNKGPSPRYCSFHDRYVFRASSIVVLDDEIDDDSAVTNPPHSFSGKGGTSNP